MIDIPYPKTLMDDCLVYHEMTRYLQSAHERGLITASELESELDYLVLERLAGKLHREDIYHFESPSSLVSFLLGLRFSEDYVHRSVNHEEEHAAKARELGLPFVYGCWLLRYDPDSDRVPIEVNPDGIVASVFLYLPCKASADDARQIRLAASAPSSTDY